MDDERELSLDEFVAVRAAREPGTSGVLDECRALVPLTFTYEGWKSIERDMAATAPPHYHYGVVH